MVEGIRPLRIIIEKAQESLKDGEDAWIRIQDCDKWFKVDQLSFVDDTDEYVLTAHLSDASEGKRLIFPALNFVAVRVDEP